MTAVVSPALLNLSGLPALPGEPHLPEGNHLRIAHHPLLGLPVAPFVIQRAMFGREVLDALLTGRRDIALRDGNDRPVTLPVTLRKGEVLRGSIPQGMLLTCIAVQMTAAGFRERSNTPTGEPPRAGELRLRAFVASAGQGPALVGVRDAAPYFVSACAITEIEIVGTGQVTDLRWFAAQDVGERAKWRSVAVLHLPHREGLRYLSVKDAEARCDKRVEQQAPQRRPLQETLGATDPAAAPAFSPAEQLDRVRALGQPLQTDLDHLIDGPQAPLQAFESLPLTDEAGRPLATAAGEESSIATLRLARVLQGTLDPGVAAWLGYLGCDFKPDPPDGLTLYRVMACFRHPQSIGAKPEDLPNAALQTVPPSDRMDEAAVQGLFYKLTIDLLKAEGSELVGRLEPGSDYLVMSAIAAVDRRAPLAPLPPPQLLSAEHQAWLPAVPPAAVREVACALRGVWIGATLAAEREQPLPGGFKGLNAPVAASRWHRLMTLGLGTLQGQPLAAPNPPQGLLHDRGCAAEAAVYHVAQQDRFGRWSPFNAVTAAAGPRPKPPRPVLQGSYTPPSVADAAVTGGTLSLRVALPEPASLAPGSHPLAQVRLSLRHHNVASPAVETPLPDVTVAVAAAIAIEPPPGGEPPRRALPATLTGPVLQPVEQRRIVIEARWVDTAGQESAPSEPLRLKMTDPRAPAQMPIADVLAYSARPDAMGLAWVERSWTVPAGPALNYAVYYSDENRLLAWLKESGQAARAAQISALRDRAQRAGQLRALQASFPDHLFERLPAAVEAASATTRRFRHALSGSMRVLSAYKIAVEAPASGARPDLSALDLLLIAVPNADPPPRPSVAVRLVPPQPGEPEVVAEVRVSMRAGLTAGVKARLYRTRGDRADPLSSPVIAQLALSAPDAVTGEQHAVYRDLGAADIAPAARLKAFARYQWIAEVQGAPESGSSVPGLWSQPSDPTSLLTVPLADPAAPRLTGFGGLPVAGGTQDLTLAIEHPLGLAPTVAGPWRFQLERIAADGSSALANEGPILLEPALLDDGSPDGTLMPSGTALRLRLYDPVGRPTPMLELLTP